MNFKPQILVDTLKVVEIAKIKRCPKCNQEKLAYEFYLDSSRKSGLSTYCKSCDAKTRQIRQLRERSKKMSELVHTKQLADDFGIAEALAASYLSTAKLSAHKLLVGKDTMSLFDKIAATKAIGDRIKEEKGIQAANLARLEAAKIPTLKDVMSAIKALSIDTSDVAELAESVKKLAEQNICLFKVLTEFKAETQTRLSNLQAVAAGQQHEPKAETVIRMREPLPSVSPIRVGIVGLHSGDHAQIKNEFGDMFRLSILTPDDLKNIKTNLRNMDVIYLMSKYVSQKHISLLNSIGQSPRIISGTVNDLKETLTALYLKV